MKISSIRIQKFRSIDDATIIFGQVLAIVGANNVGKSHVLRALNAFFNFADEKDNFINRDHSYSSNARPRITVTFTDIVAEDSIDPELMYAGKLTIAFIYRRDRANPIYEVHIGNDKRTIDTDTFLRLIAHYRFIYVPIIRDYDTSFATGTGIAYRLLSKILQQQIQNRNTVQPLVDKLYQKIETTVFRTALSKIRRFYPFSDNEQFRLVINTNDLADSILRDVSLIMIESSQENEINNCGSGIQSAVYFAISLAMSMDSDTNYLVGVEEPELNMHPQAQRQLIDSLKDAQRYPNTQFVLTTHSPVIIDKLGHTSIALCRKSKGSTRDIVTSISQLREDIWQQYQILEERYDNFFMYKNSDFFFSNMIVITESPVDCNVFKALLEKSGIDIEDVGLSFIPADGERSIKYPYALAKELGIPFICIVDRDVFVPYLNDQRKLSLDDAGIPQYKDEIKSSSPICDLISDVDLFALKERLASNEYNAAIDILAPYHIVMMRYAVEVDLVICTSYCNAYCDFLHITDDKRTSSHLLTECNKRIKAYDVIKYVLDQTSTRNLPASYRIIVREVRKMIN